nr:redoxin domain-containing protein [Cohnella algarum]
MCILVIGGIAISQSFVSSDKSLRKGGRPPEFSLLGVDGKVYRLSDYKGKALVINFWGTFCPPCVIEMPEFQRQYEKWKSKSFEILAINLSEDKITVNNFKQRYNLTFPLLYDQNRKIEREYQIRSYPTTFFVNPDGTIMDIFVGGMTEKDIDDRIRELLKN